MKVFNPQDLKRLFRPAKDSSKGENGQVVIIGGSALFHGAPILALKTASRIVDMVFFTSPEPAVGEAAERLRSELSSFIWVPYGEIGQYINKSNAVLIGPGFMRLTKEGERGKDVDKIGVKSKQITEELLKKFPEKQWIIDGGSLQTMEAKYIPNNAILTPNLREFKMLFGGDTKDVISDTRYVIRDMENDLSRLTSHVSRLARKYNCIIVLKLPETIVCSPEECVVIKENNPGLTKGGVGDVLAGVTVALAAKNEPFLAASSAVFIWKKAASDLYKEVGFGYNADDLAEKIPEVLGGYLKSTT